MNEPVDTIVRIRDVRKTYRRAEEEVHALRGITLDIRRGQYVSILGPSGSGKSTLFNLIGGLDTPTAGEVRIDGCRLADLSARQLAWVRCHRIGFVFQAFNLIPAMTALENVAIARIFAGVPPAQARRDAADMLARVGLAHRLGHLPGEVSGGQQQRIAIARALVNRPALVLADEPTGNLDLQTGEEMIRLIGELQTGMGITVVAATHDLKMLAASDRVVWIENGSIVRQARRGEVSIAVGTVDDHAVA